MEYQLPNQDEAKAFCAILGFPQLKDITLLGVKAKEDHYIFIGANSAMPTINLETFLSSIFLPLGRIKLSGKSDEEKENLIRMVFVLFKKEEPTDKDLDKYKKVPWISWGNGYINPLIVENTSSRKPIFGGPILAAFVAYYNCIKKFEKGLVYNYSAIRELMEIEA